jgi:hypothetical protein
LQGRHLDHTNKATVREAALSRRAFAHWKMIRILMLRRVVVSAVVAKVE